MPAPLPQDLKQARAELRKEKRQEIDLRKSLRKPTTSPGNLGGSSALVQEIGRQELQNVEEKLADVIRDAADNPRAQTMDRFDIICHYFQLCEEQGIPPRFDSHAEAFGNKGDCWLRRFLSRHDLQLKRPVAKKPLDLPEIRLNLEKVWQDHEDFLRLALVEVEASRQAGRPARLILVNGDESCFRFRYQGLRVAVARDSAADPQQHATEGDSKKCFSLLSWVTSDKDFYIPPVVVATMK